MIVRCCFYVLDKFSWSVNACYMCLTIFFFAIFNQVIADIDKDGVSEMVVAVSYFFDHE